MDDAEAQSMLGRCFTEASEGFHRSYQNRQEAMVTYKIYLEKVGYAWKSNHERALVDENR